jgi:hypothetical protein
MFRSVGWVLLVIVTMRSAYAEPTITATSESLPKRHAVYSHQVHRRFAVGAVGSFTMLSDQRMLTFSPSVTAYPFGVLRHRLFVDAGPQLVHLSTPSPVPEWMGTSETGLGGQVSTGYEYRGAMFARLFVMGVAGKSGVAPWLGMDLGWAF